MDKERTYVLAVNGGSSSLKFGLYETGSLTRELSGLVQRIGDGEGHFEIQDAGNKVLADIRKSYPDSGAATRELIDWLKERSSRYPIAAIGHRIVQGGLGHREPELITKDLIQSLEKIIELAPNHLPSELETIRAFGEAFVHATQVACYDTAFHREMPEYARSYPIPRIGREEGLIRYGFHGLSYEYIMQELDNKGGERVIIAHLGNGCSMAAVHAGRGIDTTMGLTPTGGLVMGTRTGDLDPGLVLYLLLQKKIPAEELEQILTKQSGLKALSGGISDVQELLAKETTDPNAALALTVFCYQAKKFIGSLSAALGGLDTLVFTGGIGEHAAVIRQRICEGLQFLGIDIDTALNEAGVAIISPASGRVSVRVIPTNEELMIARHTDKLWRS